MERFNCIPNQTNIEIREEKIKRIEKKVDDNIVVYKESTIPKKKREGSSCFERKLWSKSQGKGQHSKHKVRYANGMVIASETCDVLIIIIDKLC